MGLRLFPFLRLFWLLLGLFLFCLFGLVGFGFVFGLLFGVVFGLFGIGWLMFLGFGLWCM